VVIALVASYVGPVRNYRERQSELRSQELILKDLIAERDQVRARIAESNSPAVLEARARQLGYMKPGEIPFRVIGLDAASGAGGIWDWIAYPPGS